MSEQIATRNKLKHKEDINLVLENIFHGDNKWVINFLKDVLLQLKALHLILFDDNFLFDALHGKGQPCVAVCDQEHSAKCTFSQNTFDVEIGQNCWVLDAIWNRNDFGGVVGYAQLYLFCAQIACSSQNGGIFQA